MKKIFNVFAIPIFCFLMCEYYDNPFVFYTSDLMMSINMAILIVYISKKENKKNK